MKKSIHILLPMIFISILLILLTGCFGTIPDESPGYTPGTIQGIIAAPCCSTSGDLVTEPQSEFPNYWCDLCQKPSSWYLQDEVEVVLTYGEEEIAKTKTNDEGEFTFNNVQPGKNYVITAYCPDFNDERPLVKDVALEVLAGSSSDTRITDLVSTSLGLVVDFIVTYSELTPEDIVLEEVVGDRPNFSHFPKFKELVIEVRRVLEKNCGNLNTDDDVQDALCRAAEEITGLDFGCHPGYTPGPPPATTYRVFYNGNGYTGGTVPTDTNNYAQGATVTVLGPGTLTRANYTFVEWNTAADGSGTAYDPTDTFNMPAANVTLYAQWDENPKYTVTYDANGGTGSQTDANSPYYEGEEVTVLDKGTMSMAGGYVFDSWNTAANGSGTAYDPTDTFNMPAANVTLYAQWVCDPCSGWDATGVTVEKYQLGPGSSNPRIDVNGTITGPACAGITEIDIELKLYNNGGQEKESFTDHLTSSNNTFTVDLFVEPAFYNSITNYKLFITVPGCSSVIMIKEGPVVEM